MTVTTSTLDSTLGPITSRRLVDRVSKAHDASHYLLTPQAVVTARSVDDVARTLAAGRSDGVPVTFRHFHEWPPRTRQPRLRERGVPGEGAVVEPVPAPGP